jgi:hypothetical protein
MGRVKNACFNCTKIFQAALPQQCFEIAYLVKMYKRARVKSSQKYHILG